MIVPMILSTPNRMTVQTKKVDKNKKPRGRPPTGRGHQVNVMIGSDVKAALQSYIADRGGSIKVTEAIRRLLLEGLGAKGYFRE